MRSIEDKREGRMANGIAGSQRNNASSPGPWLLPHWSCRRRARTAGVVSYVNRWRKGKDLNGCFD
jgi:hypothetical protein